MDSDIKMDVKMNNKCFPDIEKLARGEKADESQIEEVLDYIGKRLDCADFRLVCVLRTLYDFGELVSAPTLEKMKKAVLGFKYWMDEPGEDSMCYWSENHQLLFAACEYLAGQLWPEETFTNSGMTGKEHMRKAKERLDFWFWSRFRFGFSEWHSNTYYEEDAAPLSLLVDCSKDEELAKKAAIAMDLLLLDMALFSYRGLFCAASGRCYEAQKKDPRKQDVAAIADKAFGLGMLERQDYTRLSAELLLNRKYKTPEAIAAIAKRLEPCETSVSMGLDLGEIKALEAYQGEKGKAMIYGGMYLWAMEAFTNPESINMAIDIFNAWNLASNCFLRDLKKVNIPLARKLGLLPLAVRILNPATQGIAIQRGNVYAMKTRDFMLSCAQCHHPGEFGDQQLVWQATVGKGVSVFATHPGAAFFGDNARNFSPSHWVGNGIMPHAAQSKGVCLALYDLGARKGYLEKPRQMFTHAWFPEKEFDEACFGPCLAAGRSEEGYVALLSLLPFERLGDSELVQRGKVTAWVCLAGGKDESGSFAKFVEKAKKGRVSFSGRTLAYETQSANLARRPLTGRLKLQETGADVYEIEWKKGFYINGKLVDVNCGRLESPFGRAERNPKELRVSASGSKLWLNFETLSREVGNEGD